MRSVLLRLAFAGLLLISARVHTQDLPAPIGLTAGNTATGQIDLTWTAVPGADHYRIKRSTIPDAPFVEVGTSPVPHFTDHIDASGLYFYKVSAVQARELEGLDSAVAGTSARGGPRCPTDVLPILEESWLVQVYDNTTWSGNPSERRQDGHNGAYTDNDPAGGGCAHPAPYSVRVKRRPALLRSGSYSFTYVAGEQMRVWIDGRLIVNQPPAKSVNTIQVSLTAGFHDIQIDYVRTAAGFNTTLGWQDPVAGAFPLLLLDLQDRLGHPMAFNAPLSLSADGWPLPGALYAKVIAQCPPGGTACTGHLNVDFTGSLALRIYGRSADADCVLPTDIDPPSVRELHWTCGGAVPIGLAAGESREFVFPVVIQPSDANTMQVQAQWGGATLATQVKIPKAHIHPLILIPGILGTMPPADAAALDPVLGVYDPMLKQLQQMGYELGSTLFPMSYDWRQSNIVTAGKLKARIDEAIVKSRNVDWIAPGAQVDVIAHSMGGLVTRTYVQGLGPIAYAHDIGKVVFIASPHRGFPEIYKTYESSSWRDFLYDHDVLLWSMDNVLWPRFVRKHWAQANPSRQRPLKCDRATPFPDPLLCAADNYRMVHDSKGGIDSMREMLPTDDVSQAQAPFFGPWLCRDYVNNVCQAPFPYGTPRNPLLNQLNVGVDAALSTALGAQNIYVVYGTDPNPGDAAGLDSVDAVYDLKNVVLPPPTPGAPPPPIGTPLPPPWRNGQPEATYRVQAGDDLIPAYSANLGLLMPSLDPTHVVHLTGQGARHKQLMYNETLLRVKLPEILTGQSVMPFANRYEQPLLFLRASQYYVLVNLCPVNLLLIEQRTGRRIGYDGETGQFFNEIPGVYSGANADNQFMLLGDLPEGNYTVKLSAFGTGEFSVAFHEVIPGHGTPARWVKEGFVKAGQLLTFTDLVVRKGLPISTGAPRLHVGPPQSLTAGADCSASATLDATGSIDPSGEALQFEWGGRFGGVLQTIYGATRNVQLLVGHHPISLSAMNGEGRVTQGYADVTVHPPLAAVPAALQPADNTLRDVTIDMAQARVCGTTYCEVQKIESSGGTAQDFQIVGPLKVKLRAAHNASGTARVYTVTLMCLHWGRWMFNTVQVRVP